MKNSQKESIVIEFRAVVTLGAKVLTERGHEGAVRGAETVLYRDG